MKGGCLLNVIALVALAAALWFVTREPHTGPRIEASDIDARIAEYFAEVHGDDPVSYRLGEPNYKRDVSHSEREAVIDRD